MELCTIGLIRSSIVSRDEAPRQGSEGAPDVWLDFDERYADALHGLAVGDEVLVITWLHQADRTIQRVHPRGDESNPLTGVFATRSPDRPNPLGVHRVSIKRIEGLRMLAGPMEAIDGTPVVDVKPLLAADVPS